jgi:hypothetical protein
MKKVDWDADLGGLDGNIVKIGRQVKILRAAVLVLSERSREFAREFVASLENKYQLDPRCENKECCRLDDLVEHSKHAKGEDAFSKDDKILVELAEKLWCMSSRGISLAGEDSMSGFAKPKIPHYMCPECMEEEKPRESSGTTPLVPGNAELGKVRHRRG